MQQLHMPFSQVALLNHLVTLSNMGHHSAQNQESESLRKKMPTFYSKYINIRSVFMLTCCFKIGKISSTNIIRFLNPTIQQPKPATNPKTTTEPLVFKQQPIMVPPTTKRFDQGTRAASSALFVVPWRRQQKGRWCCKSLTKYTNDIRWFLTDKIFGARSCWWSCCISGKVFVCDAPLKLF